MVRRGLRTSYQQRIEIGERAVAGELDREIAQSIGCSVWTVRNWRRTYMRQDRAGLVSHMGDPLAALWQAA